MATRIQVRRDTTANWTSINPVLAAGEFGYDLDTKTFRIGDGVLPYLSLPSSATGAYGFELWVDPSPPPGVTNAEGLPYVWIKDASTMAPTPATPTAPSFDYSTFAVTVPAISGVEYQFKDPITGTWMTLVTGTTSLSGFARPAVISVRAQPLAGFVLTANYQWDALFYDASAFTLWATDDFSGTAGPMCSATGAGRSFDMAGGGSASGAEIPEWTSPFGASAWGVNGTGWGTNQVPANNGIIFIPVNADNAYVEIDISDYDIAHGRAVSIGFGSNLTNAVPNVMVGIDISISSTTANVVFGAGGLGSNQTNQYKTSVTEANLLGTWKFTWLNKAARVQAPDGQIFSRDYSASPNVFGQYIYVRSSGGSAPYASLDAIRVSK